MKQKSLLAEIGNLLILSQLARMEKNTPCAAITRQDDNAAQEAEAKVNESTRLTYGTHVGRTEQTKE